MERERLEEYVETTSDHADEEAALARFHHTRERPSAAPPPALMHHHSPPPSKRNNGARFLVVVVQSLVMVSALFLFFLFAGIAAILLLHLFVVGRSPCRRRRRQGSGVSKAGLSQEELQRLPCSRYSVMRRTGMAAAGLDCAVCLEGLGDGEQCRVLPGCNHAFHKACVDKWLVKSPACPICRAGVVARGGCE